VARPRDGVPVGAGDGDADGAGVAASPWSAAAVRALLPVEIQSPLSEATASTTPAVAATARLPSPDTEPPASRHPPAALIELRGRTDARRTLV
jgi:hypothetical protein